MRVFVALLLAFCLLGCSGENENGARTAQGSKPDKRPPQPAPKPPDSPPREMIAESDVIPEGVTLKPFFDEAGTVTESTASAGDEVDVFVFVETPEPIVASACSFRLDVPDGLDLLRERKLAEGTLSIGNWDTNYSLVWKCGPEGRYWVMHYVFTVVEGFAGGEIATVDGFQESAIMAMELATCHAKLGDTIRTAGGAITLSVK